MKPETVYFIVKYNLVLLSNTHDVLAFSAGATRLIADCSYISHATSLS